MRERPSKNGNLLAVPPVGPGALWPRLKRAGEYKATRGLFMKLSETAMSRDMAFSDLVKATVANKKSLRTRLMYDVICMMYGVKSMRCNAEFMMHDV
jgi:hypothetical protein